MKTSKYSDSQIVAILKEAEAGTPVFDLCREHGMSSATFYKWRAKYGGMDASMVKRFRELEDENRRPRRCMPKSESRPMSPGRHCKKVVTPVHRQRTWHQSGRFLRDTFLPAASQV